MLNTLESLLPTFNHISVMYTHGRTLKICGRPVAVDGARGPHATVRTRDFCCRGNPDSVPKATCPSSPELSRLGSLGTIGEGKRLGKRATMRKLPLFSFLSSSGGCQSPRTGPLDREDHHRLIEIATGSVWCRSAHYTAGRQNIPAEPATHSNRGQNKAWQHNSRHGSSSTIASNPADTPQALWTRGRRLNRSEDLIDGQPVFHSLPHVVKRRQRKRSVSEQRSPEQWFPPSADSRIEIPIVAIEIDLPVVQIDQNSMATPTGVDEMIHQMQETMRAMQQDATRRDEFAKQQAEIMAQQAELITRLQ
ncbi:hypothetical protein HYC85_027964 [Camellia sinensis]|uniref:Uncharacterized protein n=1 Tax=Camellia sinensis TaxID=4442 RepID=A0A7J7FTS2_CAMSI|nr:hypothetical protein HYC85_027964 [Camellia sinensis]